MSANLLYILRNAVHIIFMQFCTLNKLSSSLEQVSLYKQGFRIHCVDMPRPKIQLSPLNSNLFSPTNSKPFT